MRKIGLILTFLQVMKGYIVRFIVSQEKFGESDSITSIMLPI
ncbi:hypothetical protein [Thalassobacillus cyri]